MSRSAELAVLLDPDLRFAELYVDGDIVLEQGSLAGLLAMRLSQDRTANPTPWAKPQWLWRYIGRRLKQFNSRNKAKANVAHHYDLNGKLYSIFPMRAANIAAPTSKTLVKRSKMRSAQRCGT
jgi:cyclopropane-fatty-acyl-phospholipid synthase